MITDEEIITEAESWLGTKWIHGQQLKGVGSDCVGFIISMAKQFDWVPKDYKSPVYNRDWALHNENSILLNEAKKFGPEVHPPFKVGDFLIFTYGRCASHIGIYIGNDQMIHADSGNQEIIKSYISHYKNRFHSAWRFRKDD